MRGLPRLVFGQLLPCRKVLAARSGFFSSVLEELEPDAVVYLPGLDSRHLTSLLDLLYLGRATVATSRVEQVARCLEELMVPGVVVKEEDAQEVESSINNIYVKDFVLSPMAASEGATMNEEMSGCNNKLKWRNVIQEGGIQKVESSSNNIHIRDVDWLRSTEASEGVTVKREMSVRKKKPRHQKKMLSTISSLVEG